MITGYERDDLIHIMKMNRLILLESDSAHLRFAGKAEHAAFEVSIVTIENLPTVTIKNGETINFQDTLRSVDDLKIFLEERLYQYLTV